MSTFLSRRIAHRKAEVTQQLIVFRIQQEQFALPIQVAHRVIPMGQIYGATRGSGVSLFHYQDQEILVIDVKRRIFGDEPNQNLLPGSSTSQVLQQQPHLLIVQTVQSGLIGIPLDSLPTLRRVPMSAFAPLPPAYLVEGNVRCVNAVVVSTHEGESPIFLLDLEQVFQSESFLLSGASPNTQQPE
jgi:purine-binding chemotaxis protein CheW